MVKKMIMIDNESMVDQFSNQSPVSDDGGSGSGGSGSGSSGSGSPSDLAEFVKTQTQLELPNGFGSTTALCEVQAKAAALITSSGETYYSLTEASLTIIVQRKRSETTVKDEEDNEITTIYTSSGGSFSTSLPLSMGSNVVHADNVDIMLTKEIKKNGTLQNTEVIHHKVNFTCRYSIKVEANKLIINISDVS